MFGFKTVHSLLTMLHSEDSPLQIAGGVALGCLMGFTPFGALQGFVFYLLIMFLNVHIGMALLSAALFGLISGWLDPITHQIGYALLVGTPSLTPLWTALLNLPIVPFTRFNNTVVLGSLVLSLALFVPVLLLTQAGIHMYRSRWKAKVEQIKVLKWLKLTTYLDLFGKKG